MVYEKVSFINVDQILDLYDKIYHSNKFNWDNFARSSDTTLSEFIHEIWPQNFKITTCPYNKSEWISLITPNMVQDGSFDTTKKMKPNSYDKGFYDIRFGYNIHKIEEEKLLKKQKQRAEQILWKTRHLFPNKAILYTCCLELLYKELYKENIDIKSTGFQSVSDLMHNSIIWKSLGNDRFVVVRNDDQKCDSLLLKKEEIAKLNNLQLGVMSIITSKYYGDTFNDG